jgi:hypothetical protein
MKKTVLKRLPLHRETLRRLSEGPKLNLEQVRGGNGDNSILCSWSSCDTDWCNVQTQ